MAQLQKFQALVAGPNSRHSTKVGACLMVCVAAIIISLHRYTVFSYFALLINFCVSGNSVVFCCVPWWLGSTEACILDISL